jgi:hypothetical protein
MQRSHRRSALWCAAALARREGYRVRVVMPRAAGVVSDARGAAGQLNLDATVAISATHIVVRLQAPAAASGGRAPA